MVFKGEKIGEDPHHRMLPVFSPVSGKVSDIASYRFAEGGNTLSIFIESDNQDTWRTDLTPMADFTDADPEVLIRTIRDAGVKLIPFEVLPDAQREGTELAPVRHFVINGIENGFAGSIAHRLFLEKTEMIEKGVELIKRIFSPEKVFLIINEKQKDVSDVLTKFSLERSVEIIKLRTYYPLGHPHLLFRAVFGKEIPSPEGKAIDMGAVFSNVDTIIHAVEAVTEGKPMIERYVSVCGLGITSPKILKVHTGTPLGDLIEYCGGFSNSPGKLVLGNPLDGMAQFSMDRPVLKDTRWLWVQAEHGVVKGDYRACINCGDCVDVCPVGLMPNFLGKFCEFAQYEEAADRYDLWTCIDCGLCAYVCPSRRPLVHFINLGKREIQLKEKSDGNG
jgi:electron transport complex protein RnfC